jgi:hypothetical protein
MNPNLTPEQSRAIEAATRLAPHQWRDGLINDILAQLPQPGPWPNATVQAAINNTLANHGLDSPLIS